MMLIIMLALMVGTVYAANQEEKEPLVPKIAAKKDGLPRACMQLSIITRQIINADIVSQDIANEEISKEVLQMLQGCQSPRPSGRRLSTPSTPQIKPPHSNVNA